MDSLTMPKDSRDIGQLKILVVLYCLHMGLHVVF